MHKNVYILCTLKFKTYNYAQHLVKKNVWFAEWNLSKIIIRRKKIWDFYSIHTKISSSQHNELLNSFYQSIFKNLHTYYIFALLCSSPTFWKMSYLLTTKKHALLKGYWKNSTLWESFQLLSLATPLGLVFVYILYRGWLVQKVAATITTHMVLGRHHRDRAPQVPPPPALTSRHIRKGGFGSTTGCSLCSRPALHPLRKYWCTYMLECMRIISNSVLQWPVLKVRSVAVNIKSLSNEAPSSGY